MFNSDKSTNDFLAELFPGIGAIVTQAAYDETNQKNARERMSMGDSPKETIEWLVANDVSSNPGSRQYGVVRLVNGKPESAGHTGSGNSNYKNNLNGPDYSIQGNILRGSEVLDSMEARFLRAKEKSLACRLMEAMQGANMVGADSICKSNGTSSLFAFLKVAKPEDKFGSPSYLISLRTRNGAKIEPIDSLQVLFDQSEANCE